MSLTEMYESLTGPLNVGKLLHAYRTTNNLSEEKMEKKLHLSSGRLALLESGKKKISLEEAIHFAKKLKDDQDFYVEVWLQDFVRSAGLDPDKFIRSLE
jgi:transcriptional regulator with XRE-family HTH domain